MKKIQILAMAAVMAFGLTGCNKNETGPKHGTEGPKAKLSLTFTLPASATRAADGEPLNATAQESTVSTVDVFVFTSAGVQAEVGGHTALSISDFTGSDGVYTTIANIETLSGGKIIYVGINLPAALRVPYATESDLLKVVETVTVMSIDNSFTMFSGAILADLKSETVLPVNTVSADIDRVVAKVATSSSDASFANTWTEPGLTMTYTVKNFRVIQWAVKSYVAPNYWSPGGKEKTLIDDATATDVLNAFAVDAASTPVTILNPHPTDDADIVNMGGFYVGENAPKATTNARTTYAMVATTVMCDMEATWDAAAGDVVWSAVAGGFGNGTSDVYVVSFAGHHYVCSTLAKATDLGLGLDGNTGTSMIYTYKMGYVHFVVWLNKNGINDYSVLRNQFIHVRVNGVTKRDFFFPGYPGDPTDPTKPNDPTDPSNPDPKKPDELVDGEKAYLQVTVTVQPWTYKENNAILE
jgi:hypothetical protein